MSDVCHNCGRSVASQSVLQNWEAVCPHCGNLHWLSPGQMVSCKVAKLSRFGIIVELGDGIEGRIHVSELTKLAADRVTDPADVVIMGEIVRAKVLRIDMESRKIGLSLKRASA